MMCRVNTEHLVNLFEGGITPLIRTDFRDDAAWERLVALVSAPVDFGSEGGDGPGERYTPNVEAISDPAYAGVTGEELGAAWSDRADDAVGYVLLADRQSMTDADTPTLTYVDLYDEPGRTFRCGPGDVASVESNLAIANMDFEYFADAVGADGVFRTFD